MHGKAMLKIGGVLLPLWFNNYSQIELSKLILPADGSYPPKPNEFLLLNAIQRMSEENHLKLMKEVLWSGVLGQAFATDSAPTVDRVALSTLLATTSESELYTVWTCFLEAMGANIDNLEANSSTSDLKKKLMDN
jgi:hypothetical protein